MTHQTMEFQDAMQWARSEVHKLPSGLPWRQTMLEQLEYCIDVAFNRADSSRLENLNMGLIAARELEPAGLTELAERIYAIQYELQSSRLPYAAKVRLGIHRRR